MTVSTPSVPKKASAQAWARPIPTAFAPSASALNMSVPERIPLSRNTWILPPTAAAISGSRSSEPRPLARSCRGRHAWTR